MGLRATRQFKLEQNELNEMYTCLTSPAHILIAYFIDLHHNTNKQGGLEIPLQILVALPFTLTQKMSMKWSCC